MMMIFVMLGAWMLLIASFLLFAADGFVTGIVFFSAPFLAGILMCRECRKKDIPLSGVLFGGIFWVLLNTLIGTAVERLVANKHLITVQSAEEWKGALIVCILYAVGLCVLPLIMTLIWRIILNIWERSRK